MNQTLKDIENIQNFNINSNNWIIKSLLRIFVWVLVWLWLLAIFAWSLLMVLYLIRSFRPSYLQALTQDDVHSFINILSFSISIYFDTIIIYLIILRRLKGYPKLKKYLRNILIIILPFLLFLSRIWFTMAWIIPNWLWIEKLWNICSDCKWWIIVHWPAFFWGEIPEIDWKVCCPWTYQYHINHQLKKPIVYLYPTEETKVNVKLWTPENLLHTYPKYNTEKWWNVIAQPNGDLEDTDTWRKLYALYWEWKSDIETNFDEWFVVEWKDTIPFLEEKLSILWLNEREAEEFIVYWLPQMENNKYNVIRFETIEEQNKNMPLDITPTPDTVIRVMMDWKAIDELIEIPEQELTTPERVGFTVVEWWWSPRN